MKRRINALNKKHTHLSLFKAKHDNNNQHRIEVQGVVVNAFDLTLNDVVQAIQDFGSEICILTFFKDF